MELNENLTQIGSYSFWSCSSLETIRFPSQLKKLMDTTHSNVVNWSIFSFHPMSVLVKKHSIIAKNSQRVSFRNQWVILKEVLLLAA